MPAYAKKHHFIPQFLLQHFAGRRGKLVIHQVMSERRFNSTVRDVGHRNFGHSIYRPGSEPDHASMEVAMSKIEAEAADLALQRGSQTRSGSAGLSGEVALDLWRWEQPRRAAARRVEPCSARTRNRIRAAGEAGKGRVAVDWSAAETTGSRSSVVIDEEAPHRHRRRPRGPCPCFRWHIGASRGRLASQCC
ncbi:DUF4238 domain-containing protein [Streptomyces sp. 184]|uniref:DUF4238 domain-containing protein n=1 Tax=Streptomyces sp. 184 TaxID=1827526 RepID=UPI003891F2E8